MSFLITSIPLIQEMKKCDKKDEKYFFVTPLNFRD